jgi:Ser/Thr protein kinase RdoA (MazF antagonist)
LRKFLPVFQPLWTHNDFHGSNLFWSDASSEAEVTDIIDVGLADRTNGLHDIATAIERNGVEWLEIHNTSRDPLHREQIDGLLNGYEEMHPLSRDEAEAVVALLPLVHAEFALSEADYFLRVLKSQEKTDLAYIGYFLGHARWFNSDTGKRLLGHLQSWAEAHPGTTESSPMITEELRK